MTGASNRPMRDDVRARAAREALELSVTRNDPRAALEAARECVDLCRGGERVLLALVDRADETTKPAMLRARYAGKCSSCAAPIEVGDAIHWLSDEKRVECARCGGAA